MAEHKIDIFVSYGRQDVAQVSEVISALNMHGLSVWWDREELRAGELWQEQIVQGLQNAKAILAFLSDNSIKSRWVMAEVQGALKAGAKVIPVLLSGSHMNALPVDIRHYQILDMNELNAASVIEETAQRIIGIFQQISSGNEEVGLDERRLANFATASSEESASTSQPISDNEKESPRSAFVVHGHDENMLNSVCSFLSDVGVDPVVLRNEASEHTTLIQKFMDHGKKAKFAIILISADDIGAGLFQYDDPNVSDRALQFRARQNVILELGFFYGMLSFQHVFVLEKNPQRNFPNFERPSDLDGMLFHSFDEGAIWRECLTEKLVKRGFKLQNTRQ